MAHHINQSNHHKNYDQLTDRLNRYPQGAPHSRLLEQILKILFTDREAELVSLLPIRPFNAVQAARVWSMNETQARTILESLASRAILVDIVQENTTQYVLPPPMAGFFEFSLMRLRGDIDQKALSELFHQYLNVEEDFIRDLFTKGDTQLGRGLSMNQLCRINNRFMFSIMRGLAR